MGLENLGHVCEYHLFIRVNLWQMQEFSTDSMVSAERLIVNG